PRWFQLYWPNDPDVCGSILARARASGYTVLVVTLDTWSLGWRPCDLDNGYLPFLKAEGTAVPFSDPVFRSRLDASPEEDQAMAVLRWISMITGTDRGWDALPFLREHWDGPIVLKGIQHVDDARLAADAGVDGIVVSNHGGRQVDGAVAALGMLPEIATAVGDRLEVLFDSGVRTGADVVKALALGAKAVLLGRPYVYGLALGGEDGVRHVVRSLLADLDLTLGLSGRRSVRGLGPEVLVRRGPRQAGGSPGPLRGPTTAPTVVRTVPASRTHGPAPASSNAPSYSVTMPSPWMIVPAKALVPNTSRNRVNVAWVSCVRGQPCMRLATFWVRTAPSVQGSGYSGCSASATNANHATYMSGMVNRLSVGIPVRSRKLSVPCSTLTHGSSNRPTTLATTPRSAGTAP